VLGTGHVSPTIECVRPNSNGSERFEQDEPSQIVVRTSGSIRSSCSVLCVCVWTVRVGGNVRRLVQRVEAHTTSKVGLGQKSVQNEWLRNICGEKEAISQRKEEGKESGHGRSIRTLKIDGGPTESESIEWLLTIVEERWRVHEMIVEEGQRREGG
jgi:hypothetical protein